MALVATFVGSWPLPLQEAAQRVLAALQLALDQGRLHGQFEPLAGYKAEMAATVNIKLVDDAEIARLNKEYAGNAYPTDVLTFPYAETGVTLGGELADIAISAEMAARQAQEAGSQLTDEVGLLVAHGLLHALGYDHATTSDRQRFDRYQRRILEQANITYRSFSWKD